MATAEATSWGNNQYWYEHMCAIDTSGDAYCTGYNGEGQIGDGTASSKTSMTAVLGGLKWKSITSGAAFVCGVTMEGEGLLGRWATTL